MFVPGRICPRATPLRNSRSVIQARRATTSRWTQPVRPPPKLRSPIWTQTPNRANSLAGARPSIFSLASIQHGRSTAEDAVAQALASKPEAKVSGQPRSAYLRQGRLHHPRSAHRACRAPQDAPGEASRSDAELSWTDREGIDRHRASGLLI